MPSPVCHATAVRQTRPDTEVVRAWKYASSGALLRAGVPVRDVARDNWRRLRSLDSAICHATVVCAYAVRAVQWLRNLDSCARIRMRMLSCTEICAQFSDMRIRLRQSPDRRICAGSRQRYPPYARMRMRLTRLRHADCRACCRIRQCAWIRSEYAARARCVMRRRAS